MFGIIVFKYFVLILFFVMLLRFGVFVKVLLIKFYGILFIDIRIMVCGFLIFLEVGISENKNEYKVYVVVLCILYSVKYIKMR